jgi:methane/ammonia monooxygenase subunit A
MSTSLFAGLAQRRLSGPRGRHAEILDLAGFGPKAAHYSRVFDWMVVACVILLFIGAIHLHVMLTAGDWDMFVDWKDRQYWPLIMPISMIMFPAALQSVFWNFFRLPIGATVGAVCYMVGVAITRYVQWHLWTDYPFTMSLPSEMITGALLMDIVLLVMRNALFTSIFGGFLFAFIFYPANAIIQMPFHLPISHQGTIASVADMIGWAFPRSATPEYIRIIERGTLRTFGASVSWVSAVFSGFICIFVHMIWWQFGRLMSTERFVPMGNFFRGLMGVAPAPRGTVIAEG